MWEEDKEGKEEMQESLEKVREGENRGDERKGRREGRRGKKEVEAGEGKEVRKKGRVVKRRKAGREKGREGGGCLGTSPLTKLPYRRTRMVGSRKVVVSALLVLSVALVLVVLLLPPSTSAAVAARRKVSVCIKNCGQCKKMYHVYFNGGLCGDFCLQTEGHFIPDCNRPDILIPFFLQRLE